MKDWFMNIDEVQLITFSPTCTSKQVGEAIVHGTGISSVSKVDLTLEAAGKREVPSHALAVITVPVYGGHVAPLALERMKELHADGAPAVVVVVYGNRAYEKALVELDAFVTRLGFKVIAGATFVGEHSYSSEKYPVAAGRPDADDLEYAKLLGEKIRAKIAAAEDMEKLYGVPMPRTPQVDAERCTHCGYCVKHCPAGAIIKGDECNTVAEKCIKCCACVKGCPQKARTYDTPFAVLLSDCFKKQKEDRIIL